MPGAPSRILLLLAAVQGIAGCATPRGPQQAPSAVVAPGTTAPDQGVPIYRAHKLAACRYRLLRPMISEDLNGLREQARVQNGNAILRLREHTRVMEGSRSSTPGSRAIVQVYRFYSATPIRVEDTECLRARAADA